LSGEDVDFGIRLTAAGYSRAAFISDALVHRRLRETARGLFWQQYAYGYGHVVLHLRYEPRRMRRPQLRLAARELAFLVVRVYWLLDWSKRRHWMVIAGRHAGRISASVRHRVFYP
jgi:GT2 family glycosyltransferase